MKPERGRRIQIAIDMMNQVEPPQPGDAVRQHVPHVQAVVEEDDRQHEMQPRRQTTRIQQPGTTPLDYVCEWLDDGAFEQIDGRRGGAREHDIARYMAPFRLADTAQRTTPFEGGEHDECASHGERRQHSPPPPAHTPVLRTTIPIARRAVSKSVFTFAEAFLKRT